MRKLKLVLSLAVLGVALWLAREPILVSLANYLVRADAPRKADVIVVLGGDPVGGRILTACHLARDGFAGRIWVSGVEGFYGYWESDLAKQYAIGKGCQAEWLTPLHNKVDSTQDEAVSIAAMLRESGVKSYLLVTSNYHTRRAGSLFRRATPDMEVIVVAASDNGFPVASWWKERSTRKTFAYEWMKTLTALVGI